MDYGDERNDAVADALRQVHRFAALLDEASPADADARLGPTFHIHSDPRFAAAAADLGQFLPRMGLKAAVDGQPWILHHGESPGSFCVEVTDHGVDITAPDLTMMWRAVAWIERQMAWRHGPFLPRGSHRLTPRFQRRMTASMFAQGLEDPADPLAYHDDYLRAMALGGYSALFLYVSLWPLVQSRIVPQLDHPLAVQKRREARELVARARRFGIDIMLLLAAPHLDADHPAFQAHPALKGGIVMRTEGHALCTSEPLTRTFYAEQMAGLCRDIPDLWALGYLIGGEGFLHCYTRPVPRTARVTNCPRCGQRTAAEVLLPLLNDMTAAAKEVAPDVHLVFWPYSSYIWTTQSDRDCDWAQDRAILAGLDRRASWVVEVEKDHRHAVEGIGMATVSDYSIQFIGPSQKMQLIEPLTAQAGVELVVKTETNIDASFHSVPYIPALQRWLARRRVMASGRATVAWDAWRFIGYWGSPSEEAAFWLDVEPGLSDDEVLRRVAQRLYGPAAAGRVIEAWSLFSDAWETVHRFYRQYWAGPLVIGPAHLFDRGEAAFSAWTYGPGFFEVPAGFRESEKALTLADPARRTPRFLTAPMPHVPQRLRDLGRAAGLAHQAVDRLASALPDVPEALRAEAQRDADTATMNWIILEADVALHQFLKCRDEARHPGVHDPRRRELALQAAEVVTADLDRARQALAMMRRNPMLGWGFTFGVRFSQSMVQEKIDRTDVLLASLREGRW